jgi:outer membrane protein
LIDRSFWSQQPTDTTMKKIIFILALTLSAAWNMSAQKFGYVDTKYILSHMPEYKQAQDEVNKLSAQWQKEIEAKYESIEKMEKAYQAEKILLTEEMRKKRESDIEAKRQEAKDMQKQKFGVDGELFKKREELIKPIQDRIYEAIQQVAEQKSLMVIFDKANHSNLLYTNPKSDLSDQVLKKMGLKPGEILDDDKGEGGDEEKDGEEKTDELPDPRANKGKGPVKGKAEIKK